MVKKKSKTRLSFNRKWLLYLLGVVFLLTFLTGDTSVVKYLKLNRQNKELAEQVKQEQEKNDSLKVEIDALTDDLDRIKVEARRLGLGTEDEVIINVRND